MIAGSGNEIVDYSRALCLGADQKACGLRERDWTKLHVWFIFMLVLSTCSTFFLGTQYLTL